jgi:type II secretory pathway pseudopilin PulG
MIGKLNKKDIIALIYISLLSIIAVVYGFSIVPSPGQEQIFATDHKRVVDLANIQSAVDDYYQTNNTLPQSLDEITTQTNDPSTPLEKTDPQTKQPYEYTITSVYSYKICATFTTDSTKEQPNENDTTVPDYSSYQDQFKHPSGHFCFMEQEQPPNNPPYPINNPTLYPCRHGMMCPMIPANQPTPAIYNGQNGSPTPAKGGGGGGSSG